MADSARGHPASYGAADLARLTATVEAAVRAVEDPELPVSIGEMGMVGEVSISSAPSDKSGLVYDVRVTLKPTFSGCPALFLIEADVRSAVTHVVGSGANLSLSWDRTTVWQPKEVAPSGRAKLNAHGVVLDAPGEAMVCPYCGSADIEILSERGVALCRRLAFCAQCRTSVDVMGSARGPASLERSGLGQGAGTGKDLGMPGPVPLQLTQHPQS
ncbi:iron-sulfur cluster assembly protein [Nocardioides marmoriginsengisoli]|nr:iron-sulfur cluster assembly protein [Nocardioides marmoriginsengisoli]